MEKGATDSISPVLIVVASEDGMNPLGRVPQLESPAHFVHWQSSWREISSIRLPVAVS
jgi:hypothetical protein